ncbi:MAG TPA: (2Fe-2S)-binding protein [Anaerolineales bacterium]|nr:(2Fe-2S)-binding protein [Anaerolineales bacterium]
MRYEITCNVNDAPVKIEVEPWDTLLHVLRDKLGLTGTKYGCGTGDCGACTVLVDGEPYVACLTLAVRMKGRRIETVEGLAKEGVLHPLQRAFIEYGALQCGYCTPGLLMAAKALLAKNPHPTRADVQIAIAGNICRCTGYKKVIEAIQAAPTLGG